MKNLFFLFLFTFIYVNSYQAQDLDCDTDFIVKGFYFNDPMTPISPIFCALPNTEGFNDLTAYFINQTVIENINNLPDGACWAFDWEVIGGTILLPNGDGTFEDVGSTVCIGELIGLQAFQNCSICTSQEFSSKGFNTSSFPNTAFLSSTVRIRWDNNTSDVNKNYGVKVKLSTQTSQNINIKLKSALGVNIYLKIKQSSKTVLCETFIPYGLDTRQVENIMLLSSSCSNNGTSSFNLDLTNVIDRCGPNSGISFLWERRVGNQAFTTVPGVSSSNTITNLSLNTSYTIRVTPRYYGFYGVPVEKTYPPIQGDLSIFGPDYVYPNGGDALGVSYEAIGINNVFWHIFPSELNNPFNFQVSGNTAMLFEPPVGGVATISVTGLSATCNTQVSLNKNICIYGIPPGPNNTSCSVFLSNHYDSEIDHNYMNNSRLDTYDGFHPTNSQQKELAYPVHKLVIYPTVLTKSQDSYFTVVYIRSGEMQNFIELKINVYDALGRNIYHIDKWLSSMESKFELSMNNIEQGTYFIEFIEPEGKRTIKPIIIAK